MRRWFVKSAERTSYVYGPMTLEGVRSMVGDRDVSIIREINDGDYREEGPIYRKPIWERGGRPTHYFFSKHLGREPIRSGVSPYAITARRSEDGAAGDGSAVEATEVRVDRHIGADGDAT